MPSLGGSARTHTISNASTFHGWLESVGLDDFLANPCACIFGDENDPANQPVPIPGQRAARARLQQQQSMGSTRSNPAARKES